MAGVKATPALQMFVAAAWVDVSTDVLTAQGIRAKYGIFGNSPVDRVSTPGDMSFALRNDSNNAAGKRGYYSPNHANVWSGFTIGIPTRLALTYSGSTFYKWVGTLNSIKPYPGRWSQVVECAAVDWFGRATAQKMRLQGVQTSVRSDQAIASVISNMNTPPVASALATGQSTFATVFDSSRDEETFALRELQKLVTSEQGYLYMNADQITGGVLTFDDRHARPKTTTSSASFNDTMIDLSAKRDSDRIFNRVRVTSYPREVATGTSTLYTLQSKPLVPQQGSALLVGYYTDPVQRGTLRIGGASMVTPASMTDYSMNSASDGTGTNLTANFSVTASYGGNSVAYSVVNNGTTSGYITLLQARGVVIALREPSVAERSDATSIAAYDERQLNYDMPYLDDPLVADDAANALLASWKDPITLVDPVTFIANDSDALMRQALFREPGDRITIIETQTGINADFFINAVEIELGPNNFMRVTWTVAPSSTTNFWILGVAGYSELGVTTTLGY